MKSRLGSLLSVALFVATLAVWTWVSNRPFSSAQSLSIIVGCVVLVFPVVWLGRQALERQPTTAGAVRVTRLVHFAVMLLFGSAIVCAVVTREDWAGWTLPVPRDVGLYLVVVTGAAALLTVVNLAWKGLGAPFAIALSRRLSVDWMYAWTRNPMVLATLAWLICLGIWFQSVFFVAWVLVVVSPALLAFVKVYEERELEIRFGAAYQAYRARTPMLFPMSIHSRPVVFYYVLTFALSFGSFLIVGGEGLLKGTDWQTDPRFLSAVLGMLAGPPIAGILSTALVEGRAGLRDLRRRGLRWRVGARWFAIALGLAPLVQVAVLVALALSSPVFLPTIFRADDKVGLLVAGTVMGLVGGFAEELGWTGFAIPRLRRRHGVLPTGLFVGILWGAWHLLQMLWVGRGSSASLSLGLFLALYFLSSIAALAAFRVLMVWVYAHTESLLVATLMHGSYIFSTLFVFAPPITGVPFLTYNGIFALVLWAIVAAVAVADRGHMRSVRNETTATW